MKIRKKQKPLRCSKCKQIILDKPAYKNTKVLCSYCFNSKEIRFYADRSLRI